MVTIEWKHYILKSKLWILIPLFCVFKFTSMQLETVFVDTHIIGNDKYQVFFEQYEGMLSVDKREQMNETDAVLNQYISYANENPAKHYIVNTIGWDAWFGNEKIDMVLLVFILFFSVYIVTNDYETGVYSIKYTSCRRKESICLGQQSLLVTYGILMVILSFLCEWIFYAAKYGLSGYGFPIQSLWTFENSTFNISILQCCICIHIVKGIGILLVGELSFLLGKYIKKLWLSFFVGLAIPIIPYMIFNKEQIRYYIQPLGFILGNGYFRGDSEPLMYDGVQIAEPVKNIPVRYLLTVLGLSMLCYAVIFIVSFWNSNQNKCAWMKKSRYGFLFTAIEIFFITAFGCMLISYNKNSQCELNGIYYKGKAYSDDEIIYTADEAAMLVQYNYSLDKKDFIIRDVFAEKTCNGYYVDENYIYYFVKNDVGEVRFHRVEKKDFSTEVIYQEVIGDRSYMGSTKYLGLLYFHNYENVSSEEWFEDNIQDFWVDGNYIFTTSQNSIDMIDYRSKEKTKLVKQGYSGGVTAYEAGILYYIDAENNVVMLNVMTLKGEYIDIPKCRSLAINDEKLCFITENEEVGIYHNGECQMIPGVKSTPTSLIVCNDKYAFCVSNENTLICIDVVNLNSQKVKCYYESGGDVNEVIYNVKVYNDKKLSLFIGDNTDYSWVLCEYSFGTDTE